MCDSLRVYNIFEPITRAQPFSESSRTRALRAQDYLVWFICISNEKEEHPTALRTCRSKQMPSSVINNSTAKQNRRGSDDDEDEEDGFWQEDKIEATHDTSLRQENVNTVV